MAPRCRRINRGPVRGPTESQIQIGIVDWCKWNKNLAPGLDRIYKITNEGKRSKFKGAQFVREGLSKGVPDLHLPIQGSLGITLYIEVKKPGEKPTADQVDWAVALLQLGHWVAVVISVDEAIKLIRAHLKI